jgi:hypothetical protein
MLWAMLVLARWLALIVWFPDANNINKLLYKLVLQSPLAPRDFRIAKNALRPF